LPAVPSQDFPTTETRSERNSSQQVTSQNLQHHHTEQKPKEFNPQAQQFSTEKQYLFQQNIFQPTYTQQPKQSSAP
jgi:hypothetical protein